MINVLFLNKNILVYKQLIFIGINPSTDSDELSVFAICRYASETVSKDSMKVTVFLVALTSRFLPLPGLEKKICNETESFTIRKNPLSTQ